MGTYLLCSVCQVEFNQASREYNKPDNDFSFHVQAAMTFLSYSDDLEALHLSLMNKGNSSEEAHFIILAAKFQMMKENEK